MGFASLGSYGSEIETPVLDGLAAEGIQFTNFHATALCSPTRASLLTGRNSHAVGMAYLSHVDDGFPGYRGRIGHDAATLAETLVDAGYNTMAIGKWHLTPMDQTTDGRPLRSVAARTRLRALLRVPRGPHRPFPSGAVQRQPAGAQPPAHARRRATT